MLLLLTAVLVSLPKKTSAFEGIHVDLFEDEGLFC